ncbi:MAG: hypothetical protein BAJALOKI1v1_400008 [Promethearchaeota archaeon]|nr:MAG: hypothetical protein BAJALOKI1v1_400008 [Candidatus Lokiarchaeota archaeon]
MTDFKNIKRFWYESNKEYYQTREGYLPDTEISFMFDDNMVQNLLKLNKKCLILLGIPGIGKSTQLTKYRDKLSTNLNSEHCKIIFEDIKTMTSNLYDSINQKTEFQEWKDGDYDLYLILDSFDEWRDQKKLIGHLKKLLGEVPKERLLLRIACRTGYWLDHFTEFLQSFYGEENVLNLTLLPLRRKDVILWAEQSNIDNSENFLEEIENKDIVSFAVIPVTLKSLIKEYKDRGILSDSKKEIYKYYCLDLCKEPSDLEREFERFSGHYNETHRYIISARCAALCLFSGNNIIYKNIRVDNNQEVTKNLIGKGQERINDQKFNLESILVEETLATALFNKRKDNYVFSHISFMEFLAADYIMEKNLSIEKILSLITHPDDPLKKFIPQLRGVISWLSQYKDDILENVLKKEPEILIQGDLANLSPYIKERLLRSILENFNKTSLQIGYSNYKPFLKHFYFPKLENLLRDNILDASLSNQSRVFAITLAGD